MNFTSVTFISDLAFACVHTRDFTAMKIAKAIGHVSHVRTRTVGARLKLSKHSPPRPQLPISHTMAIKHSRPFKHDEVVCALLAKPSMKERRQFYWCFYRAKREIRQAAANCKHQLGHHALHLSILAVIWRAQPKRTRTGPFTGGCPAPVKLFLATADSTNQL